MISERFLIDSDAGRTAAARYVTESFAPRIGLDRRDAMRLDLLAEETLGMMKGVVDEFHGVLWFEGDAAQCEIHLQATAKLDADQKRELISVSSTGRNAAAKGFMGKLGEMIAGAVYRYGQAVEDASKVYGPQYGALDVAGLSTPIVTDMMPVWTLQQYRVELAGDRGIGEADAAWDELERSIVARLADDIVVGVKGDSIEMIITRRFGAQAEAKPQKRSDEPWFTDRLMVNGLRQRAAVADKLAKEYAWHFRLAPRDAMHLSLLVEETLGMLRSMSERFDGQMWIEGTGHACRIHLEARASLDEEGRDALISVSSTGENALPKGLMAKIGAVFSDALNFAGDDGYADAIDYAMPEYIAYGLDGVNVFLPSMRRWSLNTYRQTLSHEQARSAPAREALEDLEQSIVAKLADDVVVGVHGRKVDLVIEKTFE